MSQATSTMELHGISVQHQSFQCCDRLHHFALVLWGQYPATRPEPHLNGRAAFLGYLTHYFEHSHLIPMGSLPAFGAVLPWVETRLGLLLMLGLFSRFTLIAGALVMTVLVIGTNLAQDWLVSGLQLIYCFLYYYLLVNLEQNTMSLDAWMGIGGR